MLVWPEAGAPLASSQPPEEPASPTSAASSAAASGAAAVGTAASPAASSAAATAADAAEATPPDSAAVRCLGLCGVPLVWGGGTDRFLVVRDEAGRLRATRLLVVVLGIALSDLLFAMDSVPVVLSLSSSPFVLLSSQCASLLGLRPLYFLLAALAAVIGGMQQSLAAILILIACKILLEAAGYEVPLLLFAGVLLTWRVLAIGYALLRGQARDALAAPTAQLTQLLAEEAGEEPESRT